MHPSIRRVSFQQDTFAAQMQHLQKRYQNLLREVQQGRRITGELRPLPESSDRLPFLVPPPLESTPRPLLHYFPFVQIGLSPLQLIGSAISAFQHTQNGMVPLKIHTSKWIKILLSLLNCEAYHSSFGPIPIEDDSRLPAAVGTDMVVLAYLDEER